MLSNYSPLFNFCLLKVIWDKTLEMRFLLQKAFSTSNKLPQVAPLNRYTQHLIWFLIIVPLSDAGLLRSNSKLKCFLCCALAGTHQD